MLVLFFLCIRAVSAQDGDAMGEWVSGFVPHDRHNPPPHAKEHALHNYMKDAIPHNKEFTNGNRFNIVHDDHVLADSVENSVKEKEFLMGFDEEATALIKKLTNVLQILNKNLLKHIKVTQDRKINNAYLVKLPVYKDEHARGKRDTEAANKNDTTTVVELPEKKETVENKPSEDIIPIANSTDVPASIDCNQTLHTRRTFNEDLEVSNAVKSRLLSYIKEYFRDIENKITNLRNVKKAFAADNEYNIGYMIANIDMLEINLKNLKAEMERNRQELGEKHILDMFDKVKVSNNLVTSLLVALKNILERRGHPGKTQETQKIYPANPNYV